MPIRYDRQDIVAETTLNDDTNRGTYLKRRTENLNVVPYIQDLTMKYKAQINVERTKGGSASA